MEDAPDQNYPDGFDTHNTCGYLGNQNADVEASHSGPNVNDISFDECLINAAIVGVFGMAGIVVGGLIIKLFYDGSKWIINKC